MEVATTEILSWDCPYKRCVPRRKRCKNLDEICEHILSIKESYYIYGHTRPIKAKSTVYVEELVCNYCGKCIVPQDWSKNQRHLRNVKFDDVSELNLKDIPELRDIIKRKIIYHTSICDDFKNWFDISQIKEGISRIEETQSSILELIQIALYGPGEGVKYQEALEDFKIQKENLDKK